MNGKEICKILKQIRRDIAQKNDFNFSIAECTHIGDCAGTCPRCESEVAALEKALDTRKKQGKKVVLAGISAGIVAVNCVSCAPLDELRRAFNSVESIAGDIAVVTKSPDIDGDIAGFIYPEDEYVLEGLIAPPVETSEAAETGDTDDTAESEK